MTFFSSTYHVKIHHLLCHHSPTMTISTAPSEISLPHKNHHRYSTLTATQSLPHPRQQYPQCNCPDSLFFLRMPLLFILLIYTTVSRIVLYSSSSGSSMLSCVSRTWVGDEKGIISELLGESSASSNFCFYRPSSPCSCFL